MKVPMVIRRARLTDASAVSSLLAQLGYPDLDSDDAKDKIRIHKQPGYCMLVGEVKGKVIGFISLHWFELAHWKGKMGRITSFCIDENFRSKGIGAQLLEAGETLLRRQQCIKIEVTSNHRRVRAHEFYLRLGYTEDSRRFVKYPH